MHLHERLALDLTNMIWNNAGLTGDARCCSAIAHDDDHAGVSNLILLIDLRGGPVQILYSDTLT